MSRFRLSLAALVVLSSLHPVLAQSKPATGEALRERAAIRYKSIPPEHAEAMANIADTVTRFYGDEFGLKAPERTVIIADLARNNRPGILATAPDEITLKLSRVDQLKSPNKSNVFSVYAIAYELAELARKQTIGEARWMTPEAADGLSYYLASEAIDRLNFVYHRKLWPDAFDYGGEGTHRLELMRRDRNGPPMVQAAGFWFDLAKLRGKSSIGDILNALNKADSQKLNVYTTLRQMPESSDALGKSKLERLFKQFERTLFTDKRGASHSKLPIKLANDPIVLKYDDDKGSVMDVAPGAAPAVYYKLPAGEWYVTEVQFHGLFDAKAENKAMPMIWLCDKDMKPISSWPITPGVLRGTSARWRSIGVKPTLVPAEFAICVALPAQAADAAARRPSRYGPSKPDEKAATSQPAGESPAQPTGLKISVDDSSKGHSALANPDRSARPFDLGDWMIRVKLDSERSDNPLLWRP